LIEISNEKQINLLPLLQKYKITSKNSNISEKKFSCKTLRLRTPKILKVLDQLKRVSSAFESILYCRVFGLSKKGVLQKLINGRLDQDKIFDQKIFLNY